MRAFVGPERGPARSPAALGGLAHLVEGGDQRLAVFAGPALGRRLRQGTVDHLRVEEVERPVVRRAAIACGDADLGTRFLDRVDLEQIVGEVRMRTRDPGLESARRHRAVEHRELGTAEIAVELGEFVAFAGGTQGETPGEHLVGGRIDDPIERRPTAHLLVAAAQPVFGDGGGELGVLDAGVVGGDRSDADRVDPVGDPP